jgi:cytochrome c
MPTWAPHLLLPAVLALIAVQPATGQDAGRGEMLYEQRCGACHGLDFDRVGPRHRGIIGRRAGSVDGYDYSPALRRARIVWNGATLDTWLANPEALIPGQRMGYSVPDGMDRADIIAYLQRVSTREN